MSKELRDLIESIDSANQAHSDLVTMIKYLKEEVQRLNLRVNEQKKIIQNQNVKINNFAGEDVPEDIRVLKDMVLMQREEINKKDNDIKILEECIEELTKNIENQKKEDQNEVIIQANKLVADLTQENENLSIQIEELEDELKLAKKKLSTIQDSDTNDFHQELIDAKKIIFQLTEETGIKQVKIESLKAEVQELRNKLEDSHSLREVYKKDLNNASSTIENLTSEMESANEKIIFLKDKLEKTIHTHQQELANILENPESSENKNEKLIELEDQISTLTNQLNNKKEEFNAQKREMQDLFNVISELKNTINEKQAEFENDLLSKEAELNDLKTKYNQILEKNERLEHKITILEENEVKLNSQPVVEPKIKTPINNDIPSYLFLNMLVLLDQDSREIIIKQLINNLEEGKDRELRTNAIKLLSLIPDTRTFEIMKNLVYDPDWIVKLYFIKALERFSIPEKIDLLQELKHDNDPDVREMAEKTLTKIEKIQNA